MKPTGAGLWRRAAAAWIDWSLICAVSSVAIAAARLAPIRVSMGPAEFAAKSKRRMFHQTSETLVESSLLAVAGVGFPIAVIALGVRRPQG
jgi:hypothetical protein